jgi:hypothetical protein
MMQHPAINLMLDETLRTLFSLRSLIGGSGPAMSPSSTASLRERRNADSSRLILAGFAPFSIRASIEAVMSVFLLEEASRLPKTGIRFFLIRFFSV